MSFKNKSYQLILQEQLSAVQFKVPDNWRQVTHASSIVVCCTQRKGRYVKLTLSDYACVRVETAFKGKEHVATFSTVAEAVKFMQTKLQEIKEASAVPC